MGYSTGLIACQPVPMQRHGRLLQLDAGTTGTQIPVFVTRVVQHLRTVDDHVTKGDVGTEVGGAVWSD